MDMSPESRSVEDVGKRPKKLRKASDTIRKRSEPKEEENSPSRPREEPDNQGSETAIPGGVHNVQEGPRMVRNERTDETDAPRRVRGPGGHRDLQEAPRVVEGGPDRTKVVDSAGHDGISPRSSENAHSDETNVPCRDTVPFRLIRLSHVTQAFDETKFPPCNTSQALTTNQKFGPPCHRSHGGLTKLLPVTHHQIAVEEVKQLL